MIAAYDRTWRTLALLPGDAAFSAKISTYLSQPWRALPRLSVPADSVNGGVGEEQAPTPLGAPPTLTASQLRDRAVVCDLLAKRPGAVAAAWRHFVPFVQRLIVRLVGRRFDSDDLTQEVFERFFRKVHGLRNPDAGRAFLYAITRRVVKKTLSYGWLRRYVHGVVDDQGLADDQPDLGPTCDAETRQAAQRLMDHLDELTSDQKSLIIARYVEGMELREVALAHKLSFNTMRRRLDRAWQCLERRLRNDDLLASYVTSDDGEDDQ